jgi:hypothetical protein
LLFGRFRWNFFIGFLPCGLPIFFGRPPGEETFCAGPGSARSRLPEASMISSSLSSSHCESVRSLSGIARSSCRRRRGETGFGSSIRSIISSSGNGHAAIKKPDRIPMGGLCSFVPLLNSVHGAEAGIPARSADGIQSASLWEKSVSSRPESYHLQRIAIGTGIGVA